MEVGGPERGPEGDPEGGSEGVQKGAQKGSRRGPEGGPEGVQIGVQIGGSTFCTDPCSSFAFNELSTRCELRIHKNGRIQDFRSRSGKNS